MCEKCVEIDWQIERYQRLSRQIRDRQTIEAADQLTAKLQADKLVLHPLNEGQRQLVSAKGPSCAST
jgi:hypothetical protein